MWCLPPPRPIPIVWTRSGPRTCDRALRLASLPAFPFCVPIDQSIDRSIGWQRVENDGGAPNSFERSSGGRLLLDGDCGPGLDKTRRGVPDLLPLNSCSVVPPANSNTRTCEGARSDHRAVRGLLEAHDPAPHGAGLGTGHGIRQRRWALKFSPPRGLGGGWCIYLCEPGRPTYLPSQLNLTWPASQGGGRRRCGDQGPGDQPGWWRAGA